MRVLHGDLKNLTGTVTAIEGENVSIRPLNKEIAMHELELDLKMVVKHF